MSDLIATALALLRGGTRDRLLVNSSLMLMTTVLMAGTGGLFWLIASRLASPTAVGQAGTLASAAEGMGVLAQLGMDVLLIRTLQTSPRKSTDVAAACAVVAGTAATLALGYLLLLPVISPKLDAIVTVAWIPVLCVLVAGSATNQLTDKLFLGIDQMLSNLWVNGILMGLLKCALPFALVALGGLGLYASVGTAATVAGLLSVVIILRALPGRLLQRPSAEFRGSFRFARAGYVSTVLSLLPQMVFPMLILNRLGAAQSARYFIGFQIVTLLNEVVYAIGHSMYAEAERHRQRVRAIVQKAGISLVAAMTAGCLMLVVLSPFALSLFGGDYRSGGLANLRLLAVGSLGLALDYWSAVRLRIAGHHGAMILTQVLTTFLMLGGAFVLVDHGIEGVAVAWGAGHLVGGAVAYLVSRTIAPLRDAPAQAAEVAG